ncbi:MAG: glycosyltransferase family 1 protein, partial [Bacteroidales bacterium]
QKNFRKGRAGGWKEEMPEELHNLFWSIHGEVMLKLGYQYNGSLTPIHDADFDWELITKMGDPPAATAPENPKERIRVTIEAEKLLTPVNDGVKRYQAMLLKELLHVHQNPSGQWHFDLFAGGKLLPVTDLREVIQTGFAGQGNEIKVGTKLKTSWTLRVQQWLLGAIPGSFKQFLVKNNILVLHRLFDIWWGLIHGVVNMAIRTVRLLKRAVQQVQLAVSGKNPEGFGAEDFTADLIHLPLQHHYKPFTRSGAPLLVTLHDFTHRIYPKFHTPQNIRNAEKGWKYVLSRGVRFIAVSKATARDAITLSGREDLPLDVVHEAVDRSVFHYRVNSDDRREVCRKYGIPDGAPFFLTLSSIEPRKNLEGVIQAFFRLLSEDTGANLMLVVAGKRAWGAFHPQRLAGFDPSKVIFTGFVDDDDLPYLYSEALGFCYVSHYEGFGLPLLEALNCGTPVIYGNNSSMPEVIGEAGLPADSSNPGDIARQMGRLFYDGNLRSALRNAALQQAACFSPRLMARHTLDVYLKCVANARKNQV